MNEGVPAAGPADAPRVIATAKDAATTGSGLRAPVSALIAVFASVTASGFSVGGLLPLVSILLERRGHSAAFIGLNAALPVLAVIFVSYYLSPLLRRFGRDVLLFGGLAISTLATALMPVLDDAWMWMVLRLALGIGGGIHWIMSETWLNAIASSERRGLLAGVYGTLYSLGFVVAPVALSLLELESATPFLIIAGLMALTAVPLVFTRRSLPAIEPPDSHSSWNALLLAPAVYLAAIVAGLVDSALWALLAVYGLHRGVSEASALLFLSVFSAGTVAMQIPIGWLADLGGRRTLLVVASLAGAIGALLLPFVFAERLLLWPHLFLWGGLMVGLYTLGLAGVGDRFQGPGLAGANALFISLYSAGSIVGPPLFGAGIDWGGVEALPVGIFVLCLALTAVAVLGLPMDRPGRSAPAGPVTPTAVGIAPTRLRPPGQWPRPPGAADIPPDPPPE